MAHFTTSIGKRLHYQIIGEGEPVVILNGIMMNVMSWTPFLANLSKNCEVVLVDLLDMGKSSDMTEPYKQALQADVLAELIRHIGYSKISVMGISYGGEVAIQFALGYPELVNRLLLFNTSSYTFPELWADGMRWNEVGKTRDGAAYYEATIPYFYSKKFQTEHADWMANRKSVLEKTFSDPHFLDRMERLVLSTDTYDVRDRLCEIKAPTLVVGSMMDEVIPHREQVYLHEHIAGSALVLLPDCGHCSMLESPAAFVALVSGFVNVTDPINI